MTDMKKNKSKNIFRLPLHNMSRKASKTWKQWKHFGTVASKFFPYIRKNMKRLMLANIAGLGYIAIGMLEPWPIKIIFDNIFLDEPLPKLLSGISSFVENQPIMFLGILISTIVLIALVRGIFYYYQQLLTSRSGQRISADLRVDLYSHLQGLSFSFHDRRKTGDLISRLTTDIRILRQVFISLPTSITTEFGLMIGMLVIMFFMDWRLSLLALMVIPLLAIMLKKYQHPMKQAIRKQREREGYLASIASEVFGAIKVVQGFHREDAEVARFKVQNKTSLRSGLKAARIEAKLKWASELSVAVVMAIVLGVAAYRVLKGFLSPGDILVFIAYLKKFNRPIRRISRFTEQAARGAASGERIISMLKIQPTIKERPDAIKAGHLRGRISYNNVSFGYQKDTPVLHNINFSVEAGERIAIVGPTGCGKSTIASLLPRFYDPTEGTIFIDGKNIKDYTVMSLRQNIGLVFQEPVLFATTIAENIAYGKPEASLEEIIHAARKAQVDTIIQELPGGYETTIGERGGTLSGGQRQCVAIARAIIKNTPIVIMDEPTVGLDNQSASLVMSALRELMKGKTVILISHQLETINDVDRILVLQSGRVIQEGTPSELLSDEGLYQELHKYRF